MTKHDFICADSSKLDCILDKTVDLIVTSPPYPMIEMWDSMFIAADESIRDDFNSHNVESAYDKMHLILNKIWLECNRVLKDSGFICINIGDATRTFDSKFRLFSNHSKIVEFMCGLCYTLLPPVIWHKPTNAPNKFMGSGMLPSGAYVTLEHEYILIFRKGNKRDFNESEKILRKQSAYFFEERNKWFSDIWQINGISQIMKDKSSRGRNASYPFEIPYRLINMYSLKGDLILDPFGGLGTTTLAAMCSSRNSISVDIDSDITNQAFLRALDAMRDLNVYINNRIITHREFIESLTADKKQKCYVNDRMHTLVKTKQETELLIEFIKSIDIDSSDGSLVCDYDIENPNKPKGLF